MDIRWRGRNTVLNMFANIIRNLLCTAKISSHPHATHVTAPLILCWCTSAPVQDCHPVLHQRQAMDFRVCLDGSPRLPNQIIGVDQLLGHGLDWNTFFGEPMLASALQYYFKPTRWQIVDGRKLRQYFGCPCIGGTIQGKKPNRPLILPGTS
jgi:hypothetical protein